MKSITLALKDKTLRYAFIISLILSIGIPVFIATYLPPRYKAIIVAQAENDAVLLASHLVRAAIKEKSALKKATFGKNDHIELGMITKDFGLYKLKIFSPEGEIVFSTSAGEIGTVNKKEYFHKIVRRGETYTKVVRKDTQSLEDQMVYFDVVECYVPIMNSGKFSGAFEIYYDVTTRFAAVEGLYFNSLIWILSLSAIILISVLLSLRFSGKQLEIKQFIESALQESEEKYRLLADKANEAILVVQNGVFVFSNPKGEELFGYSKEELASKPATEFIHEKDRKMVGDKHERLNKGEELLDKYSFRICNKHFGTRIVELKVALFTWEKKPATLCFISDITDHKQAEQEREQLITDLQNALAEIKTLSGLLPVCSHCKKVRDDNGYWNQIDAYIAEHSEANISHGICPDCAEKHYPDMHLYGD